MHTITIAGHGYTQGSLTLDGAEAFLSGRKIVLHTERCDCARWLKEHDLPYEALDALYDGTEDFDEHIQAVLAALEAAAREEEIVYGVFDVRDRTVSAMLDLGWPLRIVPGAGAEGALLARCGGAVRCLSASDADEALLTSSEDTLIREIDSRELAAELKLKLMEVYPDDWTCRIASARGQERVPLYALDRLKDYDHTTCALLKAVDDLTRLERYDFMQFKRVIDRLLAPDGCPWDRAQTHASLRPYLVEEAWEAVSAIDEGDLWHLADELGDVLLQVVLHAGIAEKHGEFDILDVTTGIAEKMIRRHSHVFGADKASDPQSVGDLWSRNKMAERGQTRYAEAMRDVSRSFPALMRAAKVLKRLDSACGMKTAAGDALRRVEALSEALRKAEDPETALGELLLAMVDAARALGIDAEIALNAATERLIQRYEAAEEADEGTPTERWNNVKLWYKAETGRIPEQ